MEFLKAGAIAGLAGCGATVAIALFLMMVAVAFSGQSGIGVATLGFVLVLFAIGVWVIPVAVFLGLLYAVIRSAVRAGVGGRGGVAKS